MITHSIASIRTVADYGHIATQLGNILAAIGDGLRTDGASGVLVGSVREVEITPDESGDLRVSRILLQDIMRDHLNGVAITKEEETSR